MSLYRYKEARITKAMLIVGLALDIIMVLLLFIIMAKPSLT